MSAALAASPLHNALMTAAATVFLALASRHAFGTQVIITKGILEITKRNDAKILPFTASSALRAGDRPCLEQLVVSASDDLVGYSTSVGYSSCVQHLDDFPPPLAILNRHTRGVAAYRHLVLGCCRVGSCRGPFRHAFKLRMRSRTLAMDESDQELEKVIEE